MYLFSFSVQFSSVSQSYLTLCDPMDCSTPGLPVHHQLLELTQLHVHRVSDVIQPSHPLLSPFPPAFNLSQNQSFLVSHFFASGGQSIGVSASVSVLPMNIQDWSPLGWTSWISLQSKRLSRVFSNTTIQKHPFFSAPSGRKFLLKLLGLVLVLRALKYYFLIFVQMFVWICEEIVFVR